MAEEYTLVVDKPTLDFIITLYECWVKDEDVSLLSGAGSTLGLALATVTVTPEMTHD